MRASRQQKKKEARQKWSRNANAAKARKRMESEPDRWPEMDAFFPWKITLKNLLDGATVSIRLRSARHAKRFCDAVLGNYQPGYTLGSHGSTCAGHKSDP
jgi:hypothetical protein